MHVFVHFRFLSVSGFGAGDRLPVGADLGAVVKVGARRAGESVRQAAVADEPSAVVHPRSALDEAVRTPWIGEQRARIIHALVIARIKLVRLCASHIANGNIHRVTQFRKETRTLSVKLHLIHKRADKQTKRPNGQTPRIECGAF